MKKKWTNKSHAILEVAGNLDRYNHWIISQFNGHFGQKVLEIGAGMGALSRLLPVKKLTVSDLREDYFHYLQKEFDFITLKLDIEKQFPKELKDHFDTIFSSNVFEHIKDDQSAFKHSFNLLKPKGKLLLFVPARMEIYGQLDDSMGHYRRYSLEDLSAKAQNAGFKILKVKYANLPGYFLWWGRGVLLPKLFKTKKINSNQDGLLGQIFDFLITPFLYLERLYTPPVGQSVVLIAQKP